MSKIYPLIPWIAGKRRLAKPVLPLFPAHEFYMQPFYDAAVLYLYYMKGQTPAAHIDGVRTRIKKNKNDDWRYCSQE